MREHDTLVQLQQEQECRESTANHQNFPFWVTRMSARYTKRAGGRGACAPHLAHLCTAPAADALQHPLSIAPPSARISQVLRHQRLPPQQHYLAQQDWCSAEEPKAVDQTEGDFRSALFGMLSNDVHTFCRLRILVHSLLCNALQCCNAHC